MSEMGVGLVLLLSLSAMVWHGYKKGLLKKIFAMTAGACQESRVAEAGAKYCRLFLPDSEGGSAAFRCDRQQSYTGQVYGKH